MSLRIAILGDPAMWGQQSKLKHRFARSAAEQIANSPGEPLDVLPGLGDEPGRGHLHSGAKTRLAVDSENAAEVLFTTGTQTTAPARERIRFALTSRSLFSDQEMRYFPGAQSPGRRRPLVGGPARELQRCVLLRAERLQPQGGLGPAARRSCSHLSSCRST
jgi:hypothetical protein